MFYGAFFTVGVFGRMWGCLGIWAACSAGFLGFKLVLPREFGLRRWNGTCVLYICLNSAVKKRGVL